MAASYPSFNDGMIQPSLIDQLKSILNQYPDDGQILKELIQNADDAGATEVKFMLDDSQYDDTELYSRHMAPYQGAALLAYNNAEFSKEDWKGIRMMYASVKETDDLKVGRFGLGFKSVFHMTDVPTLVSGSGAAFIDPHEQLFRKNRDEGRPTSAYRWDLQNDQADMSAIPNQWKPFKHDLFHLDDDVFRKGYYKHTLFRFPLRCKSSELCETLYTTAKIQDIFNTLMIEGHLHLLFLRNIRSIELYKRSSHGHPELQYQVKLSPACLENVTNKRDQLLEAMKGKTDFTACYRLETCVKIKGEKDRTFDYLICQYSTSPTTEIALKQHLPLVGIALPLQSSDLTVTNGGHLFCFLPFPLEKRSPTGFEFHVNGYFGVEQNRRHIKWPTADQQRVTDPTLLWNVHLVTRLLPSALCQLVKYAAQCTEKHDITQNQLFKLFPDESEVSPQWRPLVKTFYEAIQSEKVFYSELYGGTMLHMNNVVFQDEQDPLAPLLNKILTANNAYTVMVPHPVLTALKKYRTSSVREVSTRDVREALLKKQDEMRLSSTERQQLLKYMLQDQYNMEGLRLLPMENGQWEVFSSDSRHVYVANPTFPKELLLDGTDRYVSPQMDTRHALENLAQNRLYQIRVMNKELMVQELKEIFSTISSTDAIVKRPSKMSSSWLEKVWGFLKQHQAYDLQEFNELHMIPISNNRLCVLSRNIPVMSEYGRNRMSRDMKDIMTHIGVVVIEKVPDCVANHPCKSSYILAPEQLAQALKRADAYYKSRYTSLKSTVAEWGSKQKATLRKSIAELNKSDMSTIEHLVKELSIFETINGSGMEKTHFVSLVEVSVIGPSAAFPVNIPQKLIDGQKSGMQQLSRLLNIPDISAAKVIDEMIFPRFEHYNPVEKENIADMALKGLQQYTRVCNRFERSLSTLKFIATKNRGFVSASDLVSPTCSILRALLSELDLLPVGKFSDKAYMQSLHQIGLRTSASPEELWQVASLIDTWCTQNSPRATLVAELFLKFLEQNPTVLKSRTQKGEVLKDCISNLKWCPVLQSRCVHYPESLPWKGENQRTVRPCDGIQLCHALVCGSSCYIIANSRVLQSEKPSLEATIEHLRNCVQCYQHGTEDLQFMNVVMEVYISLLRTEPTKILDTLERYSVDSWVWKGDGFTSISRIVAHRPSIAVMPYVHTLPAECFKVKLMFTSCGMKDKCYFQDVLKMIKEYHDDPCTNATKEELKRDLEMSVAILNHLSKTKKSADDGELLLPVHTKSDGLKLLPLEDCVYCDVNWIQKGIELEDIDDEDEQVAINVVHEEISNATSERLGVASIMSRILCAEDLDISFGQSESLLDRINSLLQDYRDGLAIFKELIQNADDAGANKVMFVYDERQNDNHKVTVFDDAMKDLQGPAIWAYNDAEFSEEDFHNIVKLGGKTKETCTNKIGKFGLGFNSVYNLTEVPCFISGKNIVYFDPHTKYLGRALPNKRNPGIKLDLEKTRVRRQIQRLPDQFHPFHGVLGCDLKADNGPIHYRGTLFRFPLRTPQQAANSKICKIHYSQDEVVHLIKMLHESRHELLMFTQNVREVSVHHIHATAQSGTEMTDLFRIEKKNMSGHGVVHDHKILKTATDMLKQNYRQEIVLTALQESTCTVNEKTKGLLRIEQQNTQEKKQFLTCSTVGSGSAFSRALEADDLVPVGGVAVEVVFDGQVLNVIGCESSHVFCFLELPIKSPYPVHINGYFSISSDRKKVCEQDEHDKIDHRASWNGVLVEDAVCKAYVELLQHLSKNGVSQLADDTQVYNIWPTLIRKDCQKVFEKLLDAFYCTVLTNGELKFFPSNRGWAAFKDCCYLQDAFRRSPIGEVALGIMKKFTDYTVIDVPQAIMKYIEKHQERNNSQVFDEEKFLEEILLPKIAVISSEDRDAILLYIVLKKSSKNNKIKQILKEASWIPVSPRGEKLKRPDELIDPHGRLEKLYEPEDCRFPYWNSQLIKPICERYSLGDSEDVMTKLSGAMKDLGMRTNDIPWAEFITRARTVCEMKRECGFVRAECLVSLLDDKISRQDQTMVAYDLMRVPFLPCANKPSGYPIRWNSDRTDDWISAEDSFLPDQTDIVGATASVVDQKLFPYRSLKSWSNVFQFLSLENKPVSINIATLQLEAIKQCDPLKLEPQELKSLQQIALALCSFFQKYLKDQPNDAALVEQLKHEKFLIPPGFNQFVSSNQLAMTLKASCYPYLFEVPFAFQKDYGDLLRILGIKQEFGVEDYVTVLSAIKEKFQDKELDAECHRLVCTIARLISDQKDTLALTGSFYLPNQQRILMQTTSLCYDDCPWLEKDDSMEFCHTDIPYPHAHRLGVKTKIKAKLQQHQVGMKFGQKEKLTNRLKRILTGYPCGIEVLKELLQNADDAGAQRIHFVLDGRTHGSNRVFDEGWKSLQGPALLVYNDKPFSERDLEGIQNLGEGSKGDDPNKTGQYGVGFNCVYHLTDTPTFVTTVEGRGKLLCAFDPHCKFVTGATSGFPGQMFPVDDLSKDFCDVFSCYMSEHPDFPIDNGTMFRLPLRTHHREFQSEISSKTFTSADIRSMFTEFKGQISQMLLFVNNVKTIELSEYDPKTNSLKSLTKVETSMNSEESEKRHMFHLQSTQTMSELKEGYVQIEHVSANEVMYEMKIEETTDLSKSTGLWQIVQRFGVECPSDVPEKIKTAYKNGDIGLCPKGGVAFNVSPQKFVPYGEKTKKLLFCFLPTPVQTNLPVHINGHFAMNYETRHDLVVDDRSVMSQWNTMLMETIIAPAYVSLLENHQRKISTSGREKEMKKQLRDYFDIFPSVPDKKDEQDLQHQYPLCAGVYNRICTKALHLLPMVDKENKEHEIVSWHPVEGTEKQKTYFDTLKKQITEIEPALFIRTTYSFSQPGMSTPQKLKSEILANTLISCGMVIVSTPSKIRHNFGASKVIITEISAEHVVSFLMLKCAAFQLPCPLHETPVKDIESLKTLCQYLLKKSTKDQGTSLNLQGLPILLTRDMMLRELRSQKIFHTYHYNVAPTILDQFLHADFLDLFEEKSLRKFTLHEFAQLLPRILTDKFQGEDAITPLDDSLQRGWLIHVWHFIDASLVQEESNEGKVVNCDVLSPLMTWALVPCILGSQSYLLPLGRLNAVVDLNQGDSTSKNLRQSLKKLHLFQPQYSVLKYRFSPSHATPLLHKLVSTIDSPASILWSLSTAAFCGIQDSSLIKLEVQECNLLTEYFAGSLEQLKEVPMAIDTLRSLPIYQTVAGKCTTLKEMAYVVPLCIPLAEMDVFYSSGQHVFLKEETKLEKLHKYIGCAVLETAELYCQFVFPQFDLMSPEAQHTHLDFLRKQLYPCDEDDKMKGAGVVLEQLRKLRFLKLKDGKIGRTASECFDPHNQLFQSLVASEEFPPAPFNKKIWKDMLVDLGMISTVTKDHVVDFAKKVAEVARGDPGNKELPSKATAIVKYLFSGQDISVDILEAVKAIKFLPPYYVGNEEQGLYPQYGTNETLLPYICFNGSTYEENVSYSWSCFQLLQDNVHPDHFLPDYICVGEKQKRWKGRNQHIARVLSVLGVITVIPLADVAKHAKNLCDNAEKKIRNVGNLKHLDDLFATLIEAMSRIFEYLQRRAKNDSLSSHFNHLRIIPVKYQGAIVMVKASHIITRGLKEKETIFPFLFSMPLDFGKFEDLFIQFGAVEETTVQTYSKVLKEIYTQAEGETLHPNELGAAMVCFTRFCDLISEQQKLQGTMRPELLKLTELYLPGCDNKLHLSSTLILQDDPSLSDRVSNLEGTFLAAVEVSNCWGLAGLLHVLPADLRPKPLSSIVVETLQSPQTCEHQCNVAMELIERLSSSEMKNGLCRVIITEMHTDLKGKAPNDEELEKRIRDIESLKIITVKDLTTYLQYKQATIPGSEEKRDIFVEEKDDYMYIFINAHVQSLNDISYEVADPIAQTCKVYRVDALKHLMFLMTARLERISTYLDKEGVFNMKDKNMTWHHLPRCGWFLPLKYHYLVKQSIEVLVVGQYVAVLRHDPLDEQIEEDPAYIYGKVTKQDNPEENNLLLRTYTVDIGTRCDESFTTLQLYRFQRAHASGEKESDNNLPEIAAKPIEEIQDEITRQLQSAYALPGKTAQHLNNRLLQVWDPSAHPEYHQRAVQIYEHLKKEIVRLEAHRAQDYDYPQASGYSAGQSYYSSDSYFEYIQNRSMAHQKQQATFRNNRSQQKSVGGFFVPKPSGKNPQPAEGRRWLRQAKYDLEAAKSDVSTSDNEWVCFKSHQAAEKALRGAQMAVDSSKQFNDQYLPNICWKDRDLQAAASELQNLVRNAKQMCYPDIRGIPHDKFSAYDATHALQLAEEIYTIATKFIVTRI